MLNSFWNLCRVCPSMPIDKNSEYRTHFKWHDTYQAPIHEAIRRSDMQEPVSLAAIISEPAIPRRKKHPELAYRTNEVLRMVNGGGDSSDSLDADSLTGRDAENRARSEERNQGRNLVGPRSKSVDPYLGRSKRRPVSAYVTAGEKGIVNNILAADVVQHRLEYTRRHWDNNPGRNVNKLMTQSYPPAAHTLLPPPIPSDSATIRKTTEYRSQFAWPHSTESTPLHEPAPRKSISMGAIQAAQAPPAMKAAEHSAIKECAHVRMEESEHEDMIGSQIVDEAGIVPKRVNGHENALSMVVLPKVKDAADKKAEVRPRKFKTEYKSKFRAFSKYAYVEGSWKKMSRSADSAADFQKDESKSLPWYGEVIELRKKAGEYKHRSLGSNLAPEHLPEVYAQQDVLEQLSSRSNLSALALATTPRDKLVKEERKGALKKPLVRADKNQGKATAAVSTATIPHLQAARRPISGQNTWKKIKAFDGDDTSGAGLRPLSSVRHHLERTTPAPSETGVLIMSPTRDHKLEPAEVRKSSRESSVSPVKSKPSPKTTPRISDSQAVAKTAKTAHAPTGVRSDVIHRSPKRTPRPMSMIVPGSKAQVNGALNGSGGSEPHRKVEVKRPRPTSLATSASLPGRSKASGRGGKTVHTTEAAGFENVPKTHGETRTVKASSASASKPSAPPTRTGPTLPKETVPIVNGDDSFLDKDDVHGKDETEVSSKIDESREIEETKMMKSPPEPTRVKSPEQVLVRSPEPVKWTIPLETGIKWTGSPKIEGESLKSFKDDTQSPPSISSPVQSPSASVLPQEIASCSASVRSEEPKAAVGMTTSPSSSRSLASDVLERARTRFDQFWGKSKDK